MITERTKELIDAQLTGELDDRELAELDGLLEESPEAREYQSQMQALDAFLERVPEKEPPDGLHAGIMNSIQLPGAGRRPAFGFGQFPGFVRYGFAAAAGLLLAIGIYEYRPGMEEVRDTVGMAGTIMPGQHQAPGVVLDRTSFKLEQLSTEVSLSRQAGQLMLEVRMNASEPVDALVEFGSAGLSFDAVAQMQSDLDSIEVAQGSLRIAAEGRQHFTVLLHPGPDSVAEARLRVDWSSHGKLLKSSELTVKQ